MLPDLSVLRLLTQRYAAVVQGLGLSPGEQPLVLPNGEWFPDRFTGDQESLELLLARMQGYAGLEETPIRSLVTGEVGDCDSGGCGTGSCAAPSLGGETPTLSREDSGYLIEIPGPALGHPIALTATLSRMLGHVRLSEAGEAEPSAMPAELAATALGFGVLLLEGSFLYSKSCGGPNVGTATALSPGELALPFALFLAHEDHAARPALKELGATQKAAVEEALALVASNPRLVERLRRDPGRVARGGFELGEARSWLSRIFGAKNKPPRDRVEAALEALERGESVDAVAGMLGADARERAAAE
jgi:hypothetical protein